MGGEVPRLEDELVGDEDGGLDGGDLAVAGGPPVGGLDGGDLAVAGGPQLIGVRGENGGGGDGLLSSSDTWS